MGDFEQRYLERTRGEDLDADAQLLRQRLRAGSLEPARLRLAAYLGDRASQAALSDPPAASPDLQAWIRELEPFGALGVQAGVRAAIEAGRLVLPRWDELRPNDPRPHRLLAAAVAWARCPCFDHACAARGRLTRRLDSEELERVVTTLRLVPAAAEVAQSPSATAPRRSLFYAAAACSLAAGLVGEVRTRCAIQRALVPWALGLGDPLEAESGG